MSIETLWCSSFNNLSKVFFKNIYSREKKFRETICKEKVSYFQFFHIWIFCFKKSLQKGWCGMKDVFRKSCIFNSEKSFAFAICGECVVKMFSNIIMSSCANPFSKKYFQTLFCLNWWRKIRKHTFCLC